MAISKIILNGVTQMDLTQDSVAAGNLIAPNTAHGADGNAIVGTASGGGSSAWTKIAETSYQASTTSTSVATLATLSTGHSELWTSDKILYIRIRDTAGKRNGYFYGTDVWFINMVPQNNSSSSSTSNGILMHIWSVTSSGTYSHRQGYGTTGYGVYPNSISSDGNINFMTRYNSSYSGTINGTYKVEVYLLNPPTGAPIFT